jgi:hypothetical protein
MERHDRPRVSCKPVPGLPKPRLWSPHRTAPRRHYLNARVPALPEMARVRPPDRPRAGRAHPALKPRLGDPAQHAQRLRRPRRPGARQPARDGPGRSCCAARIDPIEALRAGWPAPLATRFGGRMGGGRGGCLSVPGRAPAPEGGEAASPIEMCRSKARLSGRLVGHRNCRTVHEDPRCA